jgi:hypothetical protein
MRLSDLIEARADVGRRGADRGPEIFRPSRDGWRGAHKNQQGEDRGRARPCQKSLHIVSPG